MSNEPTAVSAARMLAANGQDTSPLIVRELLAIIDEQRKRTP